ncbi:hypothetical protein Tco_0640289 [Tanacetum coccineum]
MDDPNITMEEYIRLEEEKSRRHGKVYNWETATLSCDESDDEDYTVIFDKDLFSYKIISANDLKTDSENDNEKVNMPSFSSPEPTVSYFNDLDFFKDFEKEFSAIVYNDALTSKLDFLTETAVSPQHINEFDETSLSKCDDDGQNVIYFNDLFPFNVIYPDDLSNMDNDNNKINIEHSLGDLSTEPLPTVIKIDAQWSNKLLKTIIMVYLVKVNEKARILKLKQRNMMKTNSDIQYGVSIKEDTAYLYLHFTKDHEGTRSNTAYLEELNAPYSSYRM